MSGSYAINRLVLHVALPGISTAAIVGLYFTPVDVFGCAGRGLIAVAIVLLSLLAAFGTVALALKKRMKGEPGSGWWILSTLILMVPALLVLGPLG
jgi:uncharacterized membrane protein YhaH (DUF805 family)